ncbi:DUF397 domain-containing protein [Actinoallomurus sp. NPDC052308]
MGLRVEPHIWRKSSYSDANGECVELCVDRPSDTNGDLFAATRTPGKPMTR